MPLEKSQGILHRKQTRWGYRWLIITSIIIITQHYFSRTSGLIGWSRKISHIIYFLRQVVKVQKDSAAESQNSSYWRYFCICHFYTLFNKDNWIMPCKLSFRNTWTATSDHSTPQNLTLFRRHNYQGKQVRFEYRRAQYFLISYNFHWYSSWIVRK